MTTKHAQISEWQNQLLPHIVDRVASITPDAVFAEYPVSTTSYKDGYRKITYKEFANAINGVAWWLSDTMGPSKDFEVLAYIGPNDIRYLALILGAIKAGYVMLLTSPRNSLVAQEMLFSKLNCTKLISPDPKPAPVAKLLENYDYSHFVVPSVGRLLEESHPFYRYDKSYPEAADEPLLIVHTSGSTGLPKPLIWKHETAARNMNMLAKGPAPGFHSQDRLFHGKRVINTFPPFHGACLCGYLFMSIPFGTIQIAPLSGTIPTAQSIAQALERTTAEVGFFVPSIVLELSQDAKVLDYVADRLELCLFAGGDLPQAVGDIVVSKIRLLCQYGLSEMGLAPQVLPEKMKPSDWKYLCLHPCLGIQYEPISDGVFEAVVKRDETKQETQPTFTIFPDQQEFRTKDLFQRHPTIPELWTWKARADDIVVFLNGEKTNPISFEQHVLAKNPELGAAIVIGAQRFQAALLLEPTMQDKITTIQEKAALIDQVWPSVEEANRATPAHARIEKTMIIVTSAEKPVIRAGKGTIQRASTLQQYKSEIDRLYKDLESISTGVDIANGESLDDIEGISRLIRRVVASRFQLQEPISDSEDLYQLGMDSLAALGLVRTLRNALDLKSLSLSTIYNNPSIARLAQVIQDLRSDPDQDWMTQDYKDEEEITYVLQEYSTKLAKISLSAPVKSNPDRHIVVLTGSTGALGTYLLSALLGNPQVSHVYCLNRLKDSRTKQKARFATANLSLPASDDPRLSFHHSDLSQSHLGLDEKVFDTIRNTCTLIIHNAWPVNFNLPLNAFRPHLDGLLNLISLAASAPRYQPDIFFVSSIGTVLGIQSPASKITEEVLVNEKALVPNGYAESKWISERLCDEAAQSLGLNISFARVGQIAGPIQEVGLWNTVEWFPSLIMSSIYLWALPDSLGSSMDSINWIPVDLLAESILELTIRQDRKSAEASVGATVYHLQNPQSNTWSSLLPVVTKTIRSLLNHPVDVIPSQTWLSRVRSELDHILDSQVTSDHQANSTNGVVDGSIVDNPSVKGRGDRLQHILEVIPAGKLLDYFTNTMSSDGPSTAMLDQSRALTESATLRRMHKVKEEWMQKWISEWIQEMQTRKLLVNAK